MIEKEGLKTEVEEEQLKRLKKKKIGEEYITKQERYEFDKGSQGSQRLT